MIPNEISRYVLSSFADVDVHETWGETSFFCNPQRRFPRGTYFLTIKQKDGENDKSSHLHRKGVFRLNFGLPKTEFIKMFGPPPKRPGKGGTVEGPWDFTAPDCLMPHPVYGWMSWVCVLNPSESTFRTCQPLIGLAYEKAVAGFRKRISALG